MYLSMHDLLQLIMIPYRYFPYVRHKTPSLRAGRRIYVFFFQLTQTMELLIRSNIIINIHEDESIIASMDWKDLSHHRASWQQLVENVRS